MKSKANDIDLNGLSKLKNLFGDDAEELQNGDYDIRMIKIEDTYNFAKHVLKIEVDDGKYEEIAIEHPFEVEIDDEMAELVDSVKEYGILEPGICRPGNSGKYEVIAGHRRRQAAILASVKEMPFIIRNLSDAEATIIMVDSNKYRRNIKISVYAKAMCMKYYAIKHQGRRKDLIKDIEELEKETQAGDLNDLAAEEGMSLRNLQRLIRIVNLSEDLLNLVDQKVLKITIAVALSYLTMHEQQILYSCMIQLGKEDKPYIPTLEEANRLKLLSRESKNGLLPDEIREVFIKDAEKDKTVKEKKISFSKDRVRSYFPEEYTQQDIEEVLFSLLEEWKKKNKPESDEQIPAQTNLEDYVTN